MFFTVSNARVDLNCVRFFNRYNAVVNSVYDQIFDHSS